MNEANSPIPRERIGIDFDPELSRVSSISADVSATEGSRLDSGSAEARASNDQPGDFSVAVSDHERQNQRAVLRSDSHICIDSLNGWQNFELMPPHYRARRQAQRTLHQWSSLILVLMSITIGSATALWARGRRMNRRNAQLVQQARPLGDLRRQTQVMETENALLKKWCAWVESAQPDDSIVQVLAAAALATHPEGARPKDQHLEVQSVEIKLPREYDVSASEPPAWAEPNFSLVVSAGSRELLIPWTARLENSGRLKSIKVSTPGGRWQESIVHVNAEPLSTRTAP